MQQNHDRNQQSIAILTINDYSNYGNRLQNYALQQLLKQYGGVTTIQCLLYSDDLPHYIKHRTASLTRLLRSRINPHLSHAKRLRRSRFANMVSFFSGNIDESSIILSEFRGLESRDMQLDKIVIGSDQVWNYDWLTDSDLRLRLGLFAEPDKLLTYAASIGKAYIDDEHQEIFRQALSRIPYISVREIRAKELIKEVSGRDATVVLDPTLLLSADQWRSLFRGFVPENDRYVLTYFIAQPNKEQTQLIQEYAKNYGCRIRSLLDFTDPETYIAGPQDFVELISKSQYVFTDSYHACCFSIIFQKNFRVFDRSDYGSSMNSRMETLFSMLDIHHTAITEDGIGVVDYSRTTPRLEELQQFSRQWLEQAMTR